MAKPKLSFREQIEGFPWSQIFVIACVRFAEPIAFTSLFPYVYFMVRDFDVAETEAEVSKYSGYLSSTFAFCQVLTSFNWGKFADQHGRKPTLLIGLTGSICSLLMLGFSKNYYWALGARSLMGLLNGNVAVLRTMIGEVATERRHQAIAFSTMPLIFQVGCVIGPLIGGYLSGKTTSFAILRPLVEKYPYALPNLCISALLFTSMIVAIFFLEETHYKHKYRHDIFVDFGDLIKRHVFGVIPKQRPWNEKTTARELPDEETTLIDDEQNTTLYSLPESQSGSTDSIQSVGRVLTRRESIALIRTYSLHEEGDEEGGGTMSALLTPHIFYAVVCNFIMNLHITVHDEFLPIFLAYDIARDSAGNLLSRFPWKVSGGLGYTSEDTGTLLSSTGVLGVFFLIVVFPYVDRHFDSLTTYKRFIMIFPVLYILIPYVVFLANHLRVARVVIYTMTCLKTLGTSMSFPQILLIVHNSSPPKHRAMINGATISVSALARCTGPFLWGFLMSWGEAYNIAWLGWWTVALLSLVAIYQSQFLRNSAAEEQDEES
jgi:MFS family permease